MANPGDTWTEDEVEAAVMAYWCMLRHQRERRDYLKVDHNRWVQKQTGRTKGSVEYKFQNISSVLDGLSSDYVVGYVPARNAQQLLHSVVRRYLSGARRLPEGRCLSA